MAFGAHIQTKASLTSTASASVVMFASVTDTRWHWTKGVITVYGALLSAVSSKQYIHRGIGTRHLCNKPRTCLACLPPFIAKINSLQP